jgi:hypothetical protein
MPISDSSFAPPPSLATLVLAVGQRKYLSHIPHHLLSQAELCWQHCTPTLPESGDMDDIEIFSSFLSGVLHHPSSEHLGKEAKHALLTWGLVHFEERFLAGNDVHVVTRNLKSQSDIIASYFGVVSYLRATRYVSMPHIYLLGYGFLCFSVSFINLFIKGPHYSTPPN